MSPELLKCLADLVRAWHHDELIKRSKTWSGLDPTNPFRTMPPDFRPISFEDLAKAIERGELVPIAISPTAA